jgi:glycerophosphoryl diester phosphodiesterase
VPDRVGPLRLITPKLVELAHRHGVRVHVWTIDDADEMRRLLDLGVDGIMTDRIDSLRDVMVERGSWPT